MNAMSGIDSLHALPRPAGIGRAVGPWLGLLPDTQGVALGWYGNGPLALKIRNTSDRPRRIRSSAPTAGLLSSAPTARPLSSAPTAHRHTSLGHRPRIDATNILRAEGPTHFPPTPWSGLLPDTQGVALGWYGNGPLALKIRNTSDRPRRIRSSAPTAGLLSSAPTARPLSSAPTAHRHTSLGHRPRIDATNILRAEGPTHFPPTPTSTP